MLFSKESGDQYFERYNRTGSFLEMKLSDCSFVDLNSVLNRDYGGAICFKGKDSHLFIEKSIFYNCTSIKGGAIYFECKNTGYMLLEKSCSESCYVINGDGQFIYSYGECRCLQSGIQKSASYHYHSCKDNIHIHEENFQMKNINFSRNAMFADSCLTGYSKALSEVDSEISYCRFYKNRGVKLIVIWQQDALVIKNCMFALNTIVEYGLITNDFSVINVENSVFTGNTLENATLFYNNAVDCQTKVQNCYISDQNKITNSVGNHEHVGSLSSISLSDVTITITCPDISPNSRNGTKPIVYILAGLSVTASIIAGLYIFYFKRSKTNTEYISMKKDGSMDDFKEIQPLDDKKEEQINDAGLKQQLLDNQDGGAQLVNPFKNDEAQDQNRGNNEEQIIQNHDIPNKGEENDR